MVYLNSESVKTLTIEELKLEALRYSNLCKIQSELIQVQEAQLKKMAEELGASHQWVLIAKHQLHQKKIKSTLLLLNVELEQKDLPLFDAAQKVEITYKRKKRTQFGRTS